ncbi:hypothetical protein HWV23_15675 [Natronomonas halophila]|uniref:hypothetical protein n=1 Tax=Natronomonas halophila TaxID=2747817 RepID=UPI0015B759F7|nr:hypothetical protein [Natronomonas halophila]QLD87101.1 hypothetical protein HWV23_15675 [Natronomonas halophila]
MAETLVDTVWNAVYDRLKSDLRVVTRYDATDYRTRMRDDIRQQYTTSEDREIVDDTIVKQLGLSETETAFRAGELQAFIRVFDEAYILSWADALPRKSGFIISVDRHGAAATMDDLEWCIQYLDSEVAEKID